MVPSAINAAQRRLFGSARLEPRVPAPTHPVAPIPSLSRVQGCLLGGALGDSLGEPVEFIRSASDIKARFGSNAPAKLGYARGPFITDDTQMTLFAAEGILRAGEDRFEDRGTALARSVQGAFLRWLTTQDGGSPDAAGEPAGWLVTEPGLHHRRAPGNTCLSALQAQLGSGRLPAIGSVLNSSKGCGAVMRSAPFGLAARTREQAFRWARDTGAITHGHPSGYLSAAHFAAVIWGVSPGEPLLAAIERASLLLTPEAGAAETRAAVARALSLVGHGVPARRPSSRSEAPGWARRRSPSRSSARPPAKEVSPAT